MASPVKAACVVPILSVGNIARSFEYYTETLLFEKAWEWGDPPSFGCVRMGADVEIFFCEQCQGNPGTWMSIFVDDIDKYYNAIKDRGADIQCGPVTEPWNVREVQVRDPDGHIIRFGAGLEHSEKK